MIFNYYFILFLEKIVKLFCNKFQMDGEIDKDGTISSKLSEYDNVPAFPPNYYLCFPKNDFRPSYDITPHKESYPSIAYPKCAPNNPYYYPEVENRQSRSSPRVEGKSIRLSQNVDSPRLNESVETQRQKSIPMKLSSSSNNAGHSGTSSPSSCAKSLKEPYYYSVDQTVQRRQPLRDENKAEGNRNSYIIKERCDSICHDFPKHQQSSPHIRRQNSNSPHLRRQHSGSPHRHPGQLQQIPKHYKVEQDHFVQQQQKKTPSPNPQHDHLLTSKSGSSKNYYSPNRRVT